MWRSAPKDMQVPEIEYLEYYYQPIFGSDGVSRTHEALVRWITPDGSVRGPHEILPYQLHPDRIDEFTRFTIQSAAKLLADRPDLPGVSINLSNRQIGAHSTLEELARLAPELRSRIQVELTEDRIMDRDTYLSSVCQLSSLGVGVVLDDLTPLDCEERLVWSLPLKGVKLDRSILAGILLGEDPILSHFVYRLHAHQLEITAEGLNSPLWIPRLNRIGIDCFQGFGLGVPAPLPTIARFIKAPRKTTSIRTSSTLHIN